MSREVRMVPPGWEHPRNERGYTPLFPAEFADDESEDPEDRVPASDCMPVFSESEATHFMMYEDVSEGTPISPAFATPEELARWLVENGASAFAGQTASYEAWLRIAKGGYAPSAVMHDGVITSGVEALKDGPA